LSKTFLLAFAKGWCLHQMCSLIFARAVSLCLVVLLRPMFVCFINWLLHCCLVLVRSREIDRETSSY